MVLTCLCSVERDKVSRYSIFGCGLPFLQVRQHHAVRPQPSDLAEPGPGLRLRQRQLDQQQRLPPELADVHRRARSARPVAAALPPDDPREQSVRRGHAHRDLGKR